MKKVLVLVLMGIFLGGCGSAAVNNGPTETAAGVLGAKTFSLEDIAIHNKQGDCWMAISNKVYDISLFSEHPGGKIILEACGKEATEMFNTKGGIGKIHSEIAKALLSKFYIGDLK